MVAQLGVPRAEKLVGEMVAKMVGDSVVGLVDLMDYMKAA